MQKNLSAPKKLNTIFQARGKEETDMETISVAREENAVSAPRIATTAEAATVFGLSASYLYKTWKANPAALRAGRALRWDLNKLREWMRSQAQAP